MMISGCGLRTRVQSRGLGQAYSGPGCLLRSSERRTGIFQSLLSRVRSIPSNRGRSRHAGVVPGRGARRPIQRLPCIVGRQRTVGLWMRSKACSCLMSPAAGSTMLSRRLLKWVYMDETVARDTESCGRVMERLQFWNAPSLGREAALALWREIRDRHLPGSEGSRPVPSPVMRNAAASAAAPIVMRVRWTWSQCLSVSDLSSGLAPGLTGSPPPVDPE